MHRASFFVASIIMQTIGLNTLALALGAVMPNLKETNSAKIVSGFGGTLCLVLSFFYIASSIAVLTVPAVKVQFAQEALAPEKLKELEVQMEWWSLMGVFILTVVAGGFSYLFAL
jgi:ABC-2 type transport system permease protein